MSKPKGATPKKSPSSVSFLAAMLVGALLTMGIFLFLYLWNPFNQGKTEETQTQTAMIQPKVQTDSPNTEYEFYDLLRQQQVSGVPDEALASQTAATPPTPDVVVTAPDKPGAKAKPDAEDSTAAEPSTALPTEPALAEQPTVTANANPAGAPDERIVIANATPSKTYILQINSFDNADDADQRRAEVLMAGVDAQIVKRRIGDDSMVYQVISRVMTSPQQAAEAQQRLQSSGIDSLIVEQRHTN